MGSCGVKQEDLAGCGQCRAAAALPPPPPHVCTRPGLPVRDASVIGLCVTCLHCFVWLCAVRRASRGRVAPMLLVYSVGGRLPPRAEAQGWWWPGQRRRRALTTVPANQREERAGRLAPQAPAELTLGRDTERRSVGSRSLCGYVPVRTRALRARASLRRFEAVPII